jgi:hypothetical protein
MCLLPRKRTAAKREDSRRLVEIKICGVSGVLDVNLPFLEHHDTDSNGDKIFRLT